MTQCKHPKGGVDTIISKFNTPENIIEYNQMCIKKELNTIQKI